MRSLKLGTGPQRDHPWGKGRSGDGPEMLPLHPCADPVGEIRPPLDSLRFMLYTHQERPNAARPTHRGDVRCG